MNWDQIQGKWKQAYGSLQKQWGKLTNDDLDKIKGDRIRLAGLLQERYGRTKEEIERELDSWARTFM